jgi:hypothetical protein
VILLSVEPKLGYRSTEQERTKDGTPRWAVQLVAGFRFHHHGVVQACACCAAVAHGHARTFDHTYLGKVTDLAGKHTY